LLTGQNMRDIKRVPLNLRFNCAGGKGCGKYSVSA
jgi:hypothetical protein